MLVGWEACGALWNGVMTERLGIEGDELLGDMLVMLGVEEFPYEQVCCRFTCFFDYLFTVVTTLLNQQPKLKQKLRLSHF